MNYSWFTSVENTISNLLKATRAKFLGNDSLFCFISIFTFGNFKNPFPTITSLSELSFKFRKINLLVQIKKVISMRYGSTTSSWKTWTWLTLGLIFTMSDIFINSNQASLTKFTNSCKGTEFKDVLPWNISEIIKKAVQISTRIVMNYAVKRGILLWVWWKFNGNWDKKMIRKKKRTTSEGIKKSKRAGLVRSQSGIRVGKLNHVSKVIWDRKITKVFTRSISFTRKG